MPSLASTAIYALAFQGVALALSTRGYGRTAHPQMSSIKYYPPLDYKPHSVGIPYVIQNHTLNAPYHRPVTHSPANIEVAAATCAGPTPGSTQFWLEATENNGQSSYMDSAYKANYKVFRNVVIDFGADNTGQNDASPAIQAAIHAGASNGPDRTSNSMGTTGQPAVVYLPAGTYLLKSSLQLYVGTVFIGDARNPPVLKAAAGFSNDHIVYGKDPNHDGTINFYIAFKNIVIDSNNLPPSQTIALLDWTVSQATQLTNVVFNMPNYSTGHTGLTTQYGYNSNVILNDLRFNGGVVGMQLSGQQWVFKNLTFIGTTTGVVAGGTNIVFVGCRFQHGQTGIDASGTSGSLTVIDSSGSALGSFITSYDSGKSGNAIILENIQNSGNTVVLSGNTVLSGSVADTWVHGSLYTAGNATYQRVGGQTVTTPRSASLLSGNNYFLMVPPTYEEYAVDQFINIKSIAQYPVYGDGVTDDTANINAILAQYAGCKIIYFPAGTYIVTNTIFVPAGSRLVGNAYASAISAIGGQFYNPNAPTTMVQVGNAGDVGVAQISDMLFTVADVLQGCKLMEINIAGTSPGDVGMWNSHFRVGGAAGSKVQTNCGGSPDQCKAAWGMIHLTNTASVYIENMWGWTADHDLDGSNRQTISTGRGILIEATQATWLVGTAFEHNTLYQYNFESASNVFTALQQSETPYWQGPGNDLAPNPWASNLIASDPSFDECGSTDALCRMALFERIRHCSNLFLYCGCVWAFYNNNGGCNSSTGDCQQNAVRVLDSSNIYLYGTNTHSVTNMILEGSQVIADEVSNAGGWGGVVAGYLYDA